MIFCPATYARQCKHYALRDLSIAPLLTILCSFLFSLSKRFAICCCYYSSSYTLCLLYICSFFVIAWTVAMSGSSDDILSFPISTCHLKNLITLMTLLECHYSLCRRLCRSFDWFGSQSLLFFLFSVFIRIYSWSSANSTKTSGAAADICISWLSNRSLPTKLYGAKMSPTIGVQRLTLNLSSLPTS